MQLTAPRQVVALSVAVTCLGAALITAICIGAVGLSPAEVMATVAHHLGWQVGTPLGTTDSLILLNFRLPRVALTALVGGMLALAGASYQGVFRNPLADPYLLGSAAGAGLGATIVIAYRLPPLGPLSPLPAAAFIGAISGVALAYLVATVTRRNGDMATLLLAGIAVATFLTAIQTMIQQSHSDTVQDVYAWIMGQLAGAQWNQVILVLPYAAVSSLVLLFSGRALDVLALGDDEAGSLGVRPQRLRFIVIAAASLGTAAAVAVSGLIGFVGLVIPHIVRRLVGGSYRIVLPVSLLAGAAFLVLADVVARTVMTPAEIPIGVVTAIIGAPFFAALLRIHG